MTDLVLRSTLTSPYGRKVRIAAHVLGMDARIIIVPCNTYDPEDTIHQQNPLGKMPCLVLPDGISIFDSSVIIEYLQEEAGTDRLLPWRGPARAPLLTRTRLADGIIDAGALVMYEGRYHEEAQVSEKWLAHQRSKIMHALAAFEAALPDPRTTDAVAIGLACALAFLDKRHPVEWRPSFPRLVGWFDDFAAHEPAFALTKPPTT